MIHKLRLLSSFIFTISAILTSSTLLAIGSKTVVDCTEVTIGSPVSCDDGSVREPIDNPPLLSDLNTSLSEDAMNGTFLADLNDANTGNDTDLDGQALSYTLTDGNGDGIFTIDPSTGALNVADNSFLDYEITQQYILTVQASDGSNVDSAYITIDVIDVINVEAGTLPEPDILVLFDVSWTPPLTRTDGSILDAEEIAGYRIYFGNSPDELIQLVDINDGDATGYTITCLHQGGYYFAVTAYDMDEHESRLSETTYVEKY